MVSHDDAGFTGEVFFPNDFYPRVEKVYQTFYDLIKKRIELFGHRVFRLISLFGGCILDVFPVYDRGSIL